EVIPQVRRMRDLFGEHEPSLQVTFGGISDEAALRTLDLFARHIMPAFGRCACPGCGAARSEAERRTADPGPFHAPSLERSRVCSAPLRAALRPGHGPRYVPISPRSDLLN